MLSNKKKVTSLFIAEAYHACFYFYSKSFGHLSTTLSDSLNLMALVLKLKVVYESTKLHANHMQLHATCMCMLNALSI